MSFDWLNVPGLNISNQVVDPTANSDGTPPSVSFDFNQNLVSNNQGPITAKKNNPFANHMNVQNTNPMGNQSQPQTVDHNMVMISKNDDNNHMTSSLEDNHQNDGYVEVHEDLKVPLSLSQTQLSHEEVRTYLRWYKFITTRTHGKLVRLNDVFMFLHNFNINEKLKERLIVIFRTCKNSLNIGQFFAVIRLISHAVAKCILPTRRMILEKATIPKPKPILNSQTDEEVYEEIEDEEINDNKELYKQDASKVDFDSFTSLLLTGKSNRKRIRRKIKNAAFRNKKVRFSEHITFQEPQEENEHREPDLNNTSTAGNISEEGPLDLSLPMDQLLKLMAKKKQNNTSLISKIPTEQLETEEEREELKDMQDSLSHFKQIRGPDSASLIPAAYLENNGGMNMTAQQLPLQPLKPTSTGSANHFMRQEYNVDYGSQNTIPQQVLEPLKPTATGSANYLMRSHQSENGIESNDGSNSISAPQVNFKQNTEMVPQIIEPLKPTATGSANYLMKQHLNPTNQSNVSPNPTSGTIPAQQDQFMSFPQHRAEIQNQIHQTQPQGRVQVQLQMHQQMPLQPQIQQQQQQQQQIPNRPLAQQNVYQNSGYNALQPKQSLSQQNTVNTSNNSLTPQSTYPQAERMHSHYLSPQHTLQTNSQVQNGNRLTPQTTQNNNHVLPGPNMANNYFQSLLSHTPSPNGSNSNLQNQHNVVQYNEQVNTSIPSQNPQNSYSNTQNIVPQQIYNRPRTDSTQNSYTSNGQRQQVQVSNVNSGYAYQPQQQQQQQHPQHQEQQQGQYMMNPIPQQQHMQQPQQHMQQHIQAQKSGQQAPQNNLLYNNQIGSPIPGVPMNQANTNQTQYLAPNQYNMYVRSNSHSPINGSTNTTISNNSSNGQDILGNYQALQQQVDALQNRYR